MSAQCFGLGIWGNTVSLPPCLKGTKNISDLAQVTASLWTVIAGLSPVLKMEENLHEKCLEAFELVYKNSCMKEKKKRERNVKNKFNTK